MLVRLLKRLFGGNEPKQLPDRVFQTFVALKAGKRLAYVYENPVLLSPRAWHAVGERWPELRVGGGAKIDEAAAAAAAILQAVRKDSSKIPIGSGPIERLYLRLRRSEISLAGGEELARRPDTACLLAPIYVARISYRAQDEAQGGAWREAISLHKLTLAAVDAYGQDDDPEAFDMRTYSTLAWIDIVARATTDLPDGRWYKDALRRGQALKAEAAKRGDDRLRSEVLHRLGILNLDPYVTGRTSANFEQQVRRWQRLLADEFDPRVLHDEGSELAMPEPVAAFTTAVELLTEASITRQGVERARTLKPLAQALFWLSVAGGPLERERLCRTIDEAVALYDLQDHATDISALTAIREQVAGPTAPGTSADAEPQNQEWVERMLPSPAEEIERTDPVNVINALMRNARHVQHADPERALKIWQKCYELSLRIRGLENFHSNLFQQGLQLFRNCYRRDEAERGADTQLPDAARVLAERAQSEHWPEQEFVDATVALAIWGAFAAQEEPALTLISSLEGRKSTTASAREHLTKYLRQFLKMGAAVNALHRQSNGEAAILYLSVIPALLELGLASYALDALLRAEDVLHDLQPEKIIEIIAMLGSVALQAEHALGQPAVRSIQGACVRLFTNMLPDANATEALFAWAIAKGLRLGATLGSRARYKWQNDAKGVGILDQIAGLETQLLPEASANGVAQNEIFLAAYIDQDERQAGTDDRQVLANLRRSYDAQVTRHLVSQAHSVREIFLAPDELQKQIGDRTALLTYFVGSGTDGNVVLYAFVITRNSIHLVGNILSERQGLVQLKRDFSTVVTNFLGPEAFAVRTAVQAAPERGRELSEKAEQVLQSLGGDYMSPSLRGLLSQLREAGTEHLCIAPQGPLHFFPFHLLPYDGAPLAARWIVTYLPNLRLLAADVADDCPACGSELAVFGVDFETPRQSGLAPLPGARDEAAAIARLYGTEATLNRAATKAALRKGLQTSKRVHIATHGRIQADAPMFQCLYVADDVAYAPVHAYEFLDLDLRHVDLLTLGACETALGRFDSSDNLRGLPAAFFLCGVKTIVGTLWEVETRAANCFFTTLYGTLRGGSSKLAAFADAQRQTRSQFPEYRDWGCFYMAGSF